MSEPPGRDVPVRTLLAGFGIVAAIIGLWILAAAPAAGPDEPSHLIRANGVVGGQLRGDDSPERPGWRFFDVPGWVAAQDPECYAHDPLEPASCAADLPAPDGEVDAWSRSQEYPVWGHLLPGLSRFAPDAVAPYAARALDALVPALLVGAALAIRARQGWLAAATGFLAVTPMAWFLFAVVNPSGLVIAGGIGLWVGLLHAEVHPARLAPWLVAVSWAAMSLPRRDGMIWAVAIASIVLLISGTRLRDWWQRLGAGPVALIAVSTIATMLWAIRADASGAKGLLVAPVLPLAADYAGRAWRARDRVPARLQWAVLAGGSLVVLAGTFVVMDRRPGGFDASIFNALVGQTGIHLNQAIGDLGWLDTPVPRTAVIAWFVTLGIVAARSIAQLRAAVLTGVAFAIGVSIWASWTFGMVVSDEDGAYWQGRYYLPLLVGVPLLLGTVSGDEGESRRIGGLTMAVALGVNVFAYAGAMRRWAVGVEGTYFPWRWDTYGTPVPPIVLLALSVVVSVLAWRWVAAQDRTPSPTAVEMAVAR